MTRVNQGIVDVPGQNLTYPSVAMNADGEGVIGATLVGPEFYPTAAYIPFTTWEPSSNVEIAGPGVGPNDGFAGTALGDYRTRWGDYGAAAVSPNGTVWRAERVHRAASATSHGIPGRRDVRGNASVAGQLVHSGERLQPELRPPR